MSTDTMRVDVPVLRPCVAVARYWDRSAAEADADTGGSLPELLVAGLLAVLLLGIVTNLVAGPLRALHGVLEGDQVATELTRAGWVIGSFAADARAGLRESAVLVAERHLLIVRHERAGIPELRGMILVNRELRLIEDQELLAVGLLDHALLEDAAGLVIVGMVNEEESMFEYLDVHGSAVSGDELARVQHVVLSVGATRRGSGGRGAITRHAMHVVEIGAADPLEIRR
jgi:hypothetical protein